MNKGPLSDRWLMILFGAVMAISAGYLVYALFSINERETELAELALERNQQETSTRYDALFHMVEEDLRQEALAIAHHDTAEMATVSERWEPLLTSHWDITAIRLADEHGNELTLFRRGEAMVWMVTREGSRNVPPLLTRFSSGQGLEVSSTDLDTDTVHDPRQRIWFSRTLSIGSQDPIWSIRRDARGRQPILQVSYLIRRPQHAWGHQVIMFDLDPSRSERLQLGRSAPGLFRSILLDDEGHPLITGTVQQDSVLIKAEQEALASWSQVRTRRTFRFDHGESELLGLLLPYSLNGQELLIGALIDLRTLRLWTGPERQALIVMSTLFAAIGILLLLAWRIRLHVRKRMRKQQRVNRNLARKLDKALGERDVLNREVHHRVKNNLQVVSSLLNLQASRLEEGPVRQEFLRGKRRIDTIALVHHKLYGSDDLRNVDLTKFFNGLVEALQEMHKPGSKAVSHSIQVDGLKADQDTAIELGIILCELVSNAYQHAFPHATGGHIDIGLHQVEGGLYRLMVKNNGKILAPDYKDGSGKLGLEIVDALASQLDGSFHIRTNGSLTFEVLFRMLKGTASPDPVIGDTEGLE
ncbi:MAG: sensor histidine kinase [Flavobacteriales bacterium]|jgi:two-component sensor histidine kinase